MTRDNKNWNYPYCLDCGKRLGGYKSKRCIKCANNKTNKAMTGRHLSEEHRKKIGAGNKTAYKEGRRVAVWKNRNMPDWVRNKISLANSGANCAMWKGGITKQDKLQRSKFRRTIQKDVFKRDNYTCQMCGVRGGALQVDHIQSWKDYVELRFSMDNCRTLCQECHYFITFNRSMPQDIKTWGHNFKQMERMVE